MFSLAGCTFRSVLQYLARHGTCSCRSCFTWPASLRFRVWYRPSHPRHMVVARFSCSVFLLPPSTLCRAFCVTTCLLQLTLQPARPCHSMPAPANVCSRRSLVSRLPFICCSAASGPAPASIAYMSLSVKSRSCFDFSCRCVSVVPRFRLAGSVCCSCNGSKWKA